jgi:iron complex outermembrane receptor protein
VLLSATRQIILCLAVNRAAAQREHAHSCVPHADEVRIMPSRLQHLTVALFGCLLAASGICGADAASASDAPNAAGSDDSSGDQLAEVVVAAQRRNERLQDVPISVTAVSAADLAASGVTGTQDLPALTPGLVFGQQAGTAQPFLRGIGTVAAGPGIENPVALYVDNVYYGAAAAGVMSFNNIAQIEVDKGPQGTLFGRNATGGLIQITTKDPSHTFGGVVSATYDDYQTAGTDFYVTGGLNDYLAADFAGRFSHQQEGYGVNVVTGQPVSRTQDMQARNKWLLTASDGTKVTWIFDFGVTHFVPNYTTAPGTVPLGPGPVPLGPQDLAGIYQPTGTTKSGGASVNVQHDFDSVRFVSISAYRHSVLYSQGSAQLTPDPDFAISSLAYITNSQLSQEFQVLSLPGSRINWTAGTYLYADDAGETPPTQIAGGLIAPLTSFEVFDHQKAYSAAVYGQGTTEVAADTNLTLGLRYTAERRNFRGYEQLGDPVDGTFQIADAQHAIFKKPTWRVSLDHHFTQDTMAYVSYNRGFKSGGFNDTLFPSTRFAPEQLDAYELGEKTELLDHTLIVNTAAFFYDYKNIQAFQYLENGSVSVYNAGSAQLYGIDLDAKWKVLERLTLTGGLEAMHSKYTSFPTAALSSPVPGGGTSYSFGSAEGNRLPLTPNFTASLTGDYVFPLGARGAVTVTATYAFNDGFYGEPDNRLHQPSYNVVNAQVAWASVDEIYEVRLWGKNLTDADYVSALGSQVNGDFAVFNPPRTYGVTVSRKF